MKASSYLLSYYTALDSYYFAHLSSCVHWLLIRPLIILILQIKHYVKRFSMSPSLAWAVWALTIPFAVAGPPFLNVKWEDIMVAISEFPPITGEPAVISRTGPPKVTGATGKDGIIKPFKIREISDEEIDWNEKPEVSETSGLMSWDLQIDYSPVISDLRFIIVRTLIPDQSVLYQQVNLDTMVPIEDAFMQAEWVC